MVPTPRNVQIVTLLNREGGIDAIVNWTYPHIANRSHHFRFDLSER